MADSHTIQISVDASKARSELNSLGQSIGKVASSLKSVGDSSGGSFDNLSRQLNNVSSAFDRLRSVSSIGSVTREIRDLSSAINSLRAPNPGVSAGINNLGRAVHSLSGVRVNRQIGADIQHINTSLNNLRVSASATKNIQSLTAALSKAHIDPNLARGLSGLGQSLTGLKGPSQATVQNLHRLLQVLGTANANAISATARALHQMNGVNVRAANPPAPPRQPPAPRQPGGAGGHGGNVSMPGLPRLTGELRGLENAFSATYQAASLFRTAIGAITLGEFAHSIFEVGNSLMTFRIGLDSIATAPDEVGKHLEFVKKLAADTGGSLEVMIPAYQRYAGATRSLGVSMDDTQRSFAGMQTAISAMHLSTADATKTLQEYVETFAMGGGHATQVMRGMGSHLPAMAGILQQTLHLTGADLKKKFQEGGLNEEEMVKIGIAFGDKFSSGVKEGLNHSNTAVNQFENRFTLMKQKIFDSGFDSGLTTFLNEIGKSLDSSGFDSLGEKIGKGFREAFAGATVFAKALIDNRDKILEVIKAAVEIAAIYQAFKVVSGGVDLLVGSLSGLRSIVGGVGALLGSTMGVPLLLVGSAALLVYTQWDHLASILSGSDAAFNSSADKIKQLTFGFLDLHKALKGAIELWELGKAIFAGAGLEDARKAAAAAGAAFDASQYHGNGQDIGKSVGDGISDGLKASISGITGTLDGIFDSIGKKLGLGSIGSEYQKQLAANAPNPVQPFDPQHYDDNEAKRLERAIAAAKELGKEEEKLFDKLLPDIKAAKELGAQFETIAKLQQRINDNKSKGLPAPEYNGKAIDEQQLAQLKSKAQETALEKFDPTALKIRDIVDELKVEQTLLDKSNSGVDKSGLEVEKEILKEKIALRKKNLEMYPEEEAALRKLITLQKEIAKGGNDGFSQWAHSQKSAIEGMNDDIKSGLDSIADGIAKIATEGKGKFKNLGQAIRAELYSVTRGIASSFIKTGIKSLMAQAINGLDFGNLKGKLAEAIGLGDKVSKSAAGRLENSLKTTETMEVQAAVVNINGAGAGGVGAGGAAKSAESAIASDSSTTSAADQSIANVATPDINQASAATNQFGVGGVASGGIPAFSFLNGLSSLASGVAPLAVGGGVAAATGIGGGGQTTTPPLAWPRIIKSFQDLVGGAAPAINSELTTTPSIPGSVVNGQSSLFGQVKPLPGSVVGAGPTPNSAQDIVGQARSVTGALGSINGDQFVGPQGSLAGPMQALNPELVGVNPYANPLGADATPGAPVNTGFFTPQPEQFPTFGSGDAYAKYQEMMKQQAAPVAPQAPSLSTKNADLEQLYKTAGLDKGTEQNLRTVDPQLQKAILQGKIDSGANIYMNNGMGLRTPEQAAANAAAGRGILKSKHLDGQAADVLLKDNNGNIIKDGSSPAYTKFNESVQSAAKQQGSNIKWGGDFMHKKDWDHWELANRGKGVPLEKRGFTDYAGVPRRDASVGNTGDLSSAAGREQYSWNYFKGKGYSSQDTAKIMGNLKQESGDFSPRAISKNDAGPGNDSVGIAQWNNGSKNDLINGRRAQMEKFASQQSGGKSYSQLTDDEKFKSQLGFVDKEIQGTPYYKNALRDSPNAGKFGHAYEGYGSNTEAARTQSGNGYLERFGGQTGPRNPFGNKGVDTTPTGSINGMKQEADRAAKQLSKSVQDSTKPLQKDLTKNFQDVGKKITDTGSVNKLSDQFQNVGQQATQAGQSATQMSSQVSTMASTMGQQGVQATQSFEQQIQKLMQQLLSGIGGGGGGGGLGGGLGGDLGGIGSAIGGLFSEGGYSESPVSSASMPASFWSGAPHYAEGTPNTSGGMPAILHDNEAVIPLSGGRTIPVEMKGGNQSGGGVTNHYHMSTNVTAKDADSFRRSHSQLASSMQQMMGRLSARNN